MLKRIMVEVVTATLCSICLCILIISLRMFHGNPWANSCGLKTTDNETILQSPWSVLGVAEIWGPSQTGQHWVHTLHIPMKAQDDDIWYGGKKMQSGEYALHMIGQGGHSGETSFRKTTKIYVEYNSDAEMLEVILSKKEAPEHWISYEDLDGDGRIDARSKGIGVETMSSDLLMEGRWVPHEGIRDSENATIVVDNGTKKSVMLRDGVWQHIQDTKDSNEQAGLQ